ncbi:MAG: hypothetical protein Q9225_001217 [Loekoesia sp. 1 TL-2023]
MALLFHTLLNVEIVDIVTPPFGADFFSKVFERAVDKDGPADASVQRFRNLRIVINRRKDAKYRMPIDLLARYIRFPSIRKIYMSKVASKDFDGNPLGSLKPGSCPTVEHLELHESQLNGEDLEKMLGACSGLKTFVYDLGWSDDSECSYSLPELRKSLSANTQTLENLWIDYWDDYWCDVEDGLGRVDDFTPISSLYEFRRLKNLKVGMYVFFGINEGYTRIHEEKEVVESQLPDLAKILPESLEIILFVETNGRIGILARALEKLLQVKETCLPELREIAFEAKLTGNKNTPSLKNLEDLAASSEITLRMIDIGALIKNFEAGRLSGLYGPLTWDGTIINAAYQERVVSKGRTYHKSL